MNVEDDDPWLDEDVTAPAVLERNAAQDWERLSNKFSDVCLIHDDLNISPRFT